MKHLTSLLVLSSLCSFIPQSYAMGENLAVMWRRKTGFTWIWNLSQKEKFMPIT
jgi:hypothetical protein